MKYLICFLIINSITVLSLGFQAQKEAQKKTEDAQKISELVNSYKKTKTCESKLYCKLERK